jgi:hypothetical protein
MTGLETEGHLFSILVTGLKLSRFKLGKGVVKTTKIGYCIFTSCYHLANARQGKVLGLIKQRKKNDKSVDRASNFIYVKFRMGRT